MRRGEAILYRTYALAMWPASSSARRALLSALFEAGHEAEEALTREELEAALLRLRETRALLEALPRREWPCECRAYEAPHPRRLVCLV